MTHPNHQRGRGAWWRRTAAAGAAAAVVLSLVLSACGQDAMQRTDFDKVLNPDRCGGVKDACG